MSFEMKTEIQECEGQKVLVVLMRVNSTDDNDWFHSSLVSTSFENEREAWAQLQPALRCLLRACYTNQSTYERITSNDS